MDNPFDNIVVKEKKLLDPDVYVGELLPIKKIQVDDKENKGEKKTKLVFEYQIDELDAQVSAFFNIAMGEKAGIIQFLTKTFGASVVNTVRADKAMLWDFIQKQVGKKFKLFVSKTESNGKWYNNIDTAIPLGAASVKVEEDVDDIPF